MRRSLIIVACAVYLPGIANAWDIVNATLDAKDELAGEFAQCAAYYFVAAAMLEASDASPAPDKAQGIAGAERSGELAIAMAANLSSKEVAAARMELSRQTMVRDMKHDWSNFSLVAVKYMYPCKDILDHPDERLAYWVKEKSKLPDVPTAQSK